MEHEGGGGRDIFGLKLDMNNSNNILNRLNLILRTFKIKGQLGVKLSKWSDLAQI